MLDYLLQFNISQFLFFSACLIGLVKLLFDTLDWFNQRFNLFETKKSRQEEHLEELDKKVTHLLEMSTKRERQMDILFESDKCRIRAEITREYLKGLDDKAIDIYTDEYLLEQFLCYKNEGGNSYIDGLMSQIKTWEKINKNLGQNQ